MKKTVQETLGLFSQTLPFLLVRIAVLTALSILFLFFSALLLLAASRRGSVLAPSHYIIVASIVLLFFFAVHLVLDLLLLRMQGAFVAFMARLIRRSAAMPAALSPLQSGLSILQKRLPAELPARKFLRQLKRQIDGLVRKAIPICPAKAAGLPFLTGAILGFCLEREEESVASALAAAEGHMKREAERIRSLLSRIGLASIAGYAGCFLLILVPVGLLFLNFSAPMSIGAAISLCLGFATKKAILDPLLQAACSSRFAQPGVAS